MILTIDTERELTSTDIELLRALLRHAEPTHPSPPTPSSTSGRIWEKIQQNPDASARRPAGSIAAAKLPIASQPGVSSIESTRDPDQENREPESYDAEKPAPQG